MKPISARGSAVLPLIRSLSNGVVELGAVLMDGSEVEQMLADNFGKARTG